MPRQRSSRYGDNVPVAQTVRGTEDDSIVAAGAGAVPAMSATVLLLVAAGALWGRQLPHPSRSFSWAGCVISALAATPGFRG